LNFDNDFVYPDLSVYITNNASSVEVHRTGILQSWQ